MLFLIPLYVVTFALLNRAAGMGRWWKGNGRNIYYVAPLGALAAYMFSGGNTPFAVAVLLAWLLYRLPGWFALNDMGRNNPGYTTNPKGEVRRDFFLMWLRQSWYGVPLAFWAFYYTSAGLPDIFLTVVLAGLAGALGYLVGHIAWARGKTDAPTLVGELAAGAGLGFLTYMVWTFSHFTVS